ncbi:MAG: TRAP transporter substrate-binding protein [Polaromonas sp.]|nr:TRAP transporter substrate-binding protein [Pseudohongiella sp.]MDP3170523.1 TRAP transporter substrate-binding protein [Polaromonas sp.]MDP3604283.1 TRAP transporter substrate-binding protein [Polaromonas sp.]
MKRFLKCAVAAAVTLSALVAPAQAQDKKVRAQMGWVFPSTFGLLGPAQGQLVEELRKVSGGSIDVKGFEPGALVPAGQYMDAVANGSLDMANTVAGFFTGKDIAFALYASMPFGPDAGEYMAWIKYGGGEKLMKDLHNKYGVEAIPCGLIAPEASGWFRKEIKTVDDLKGLKMRFFGLGANVMQKLGVSTQTLAPGDIFQALQLGTIDATEFSMPVADLTLGLHQVAKFYYFPGWHQQATIISLYINQKKWAEFSPTQKSQIQSVCDAHTLRMFAEGEAVNFKAMKEIQAKGVALKVWPKPIMDAMVKAWEEVAMEQSAKSPEFKKGWDSYTAFRKDYAIWKEMGHLK